jgi:hypothetical protein
MRRKKIWIAGMEVIGLVLVILFGPNCIHLFYWVQTPETVILSNRFDYNILEGEESRLDPKAQEVSIKKRFALFLWFHARGLDIDEGDEARSIWHPWNELMDYWKLNFGQFGEQVMYAAAQGAAAFAVDDADAQDSSLAAFGKIFGQQAADLAGAEGVEIEFRADGVLDDVGDRFVIGGGHG